MARGRRHGAVAARWPVQRGAVALLAGLVLTALVGALLWRNYRSASQVRAQVLSQHSQSFRLNAVALGNLLTSSEEQLAYLADSREVSAFYESRDLGMSMAYGLGLTLIPIRARLTQLVEGRDRGRPPRFDRVVLYDADGRRLAWAGGPAHPPLVPPEGVDGATHARLDADRTHLVLVREHWFKGKPAGRLAAWLRPERLVAALKGDDRVRDSVSRLVVLDEVGQRFEPGAPEGASPLPVGLESLPVDGPAREVTGPGGEALLLERATVPGHRLTLVDLDRLVDLVGSDSPAGTVVGLTLVALLVLGVVGLAGRLSAKSLALQVRLDESQRREAEVAEKHDALERVERERRRLWQAVNQSPATMLIADKRGRIEYVNPTFERVTGYDALEAVGNANLLSGLRPLNGDSLAGIWAMLEQGGTWHGEVAGARRDGSPLFMSVSISPARDERRKITHFIAIGEDVTARRAAAEELTRARDQAQAASRAKSAFLASMSHEIRTPLNAILGYSQLMTRDPQLSDGSRRNLETINRSGEHLLALLNQVLELSRIEAGRATVERGPFDLDAMLRDLAAMFTLRARTKGLAFLVEAPPGGPHVLMGDEGKVRQVLVNLLGNAVKFTDRGEVRLSVRLRPVPAPGPERGLHLRVEVADTGPGLAEEELARLFREFEQAAAGRALQSGTGLGLAISRAFARLMGGDLTVESVPGQGATFTFEIPVEGSSVPAPARLARRVVGIEGADHPPRALVVDDEAANRDWLAQTLQVVGFEVRQAADGAAAVEGCQGGWPEVVLMDLRMPGMDGLEATRLLRARPGGDAVAVVALTASALEEERAAFLAAGADAVLAKPVREAELLEVLGRRLGLTWRYDGDAAPAAATPLGPEALAGMPPQLLDGMREATRRGDIDRLNELIDEAGASSAAAAAGLRALAERYDYEALNRALA